ncbi:MAG: glycosyltransferase family 4 protein [Bacteroidaceae bacterium]|nr:glycosyltransferase family 4 protein [Bacteroidaceae bacterium]MBR3627198.1 glycosyltransferase family 4 protein [Bacteroidaceae bacterium]
MKEDTPIIGFDAKRAVANGTGLGSYSRTLINDLARYPLTLRLYAPDEGRDDLRTQIQDRANVTLHTPHSTFHIPHSTFHIPHSTSLGKSLWRSHGIVSDLRRDGIQLYHGLSGELPIGIRKSGIPSVVTIHDLIFLRHPEYYHWIDTKIYAWKFRQTISEATHIIAISECTRRDILHYAPELDPARISVIYQSCAPKFTPDISPSTFHIPHSTFHIPPSTKYILSVGTIEARKNILLAVKALETSLLPDDLHIVIIGRHTPYTDTVARYARAHGLEARVHILHNVSDAELPAYYAAAEAFVYPSRYEGFGIPIIEAISCGLPVVACTGSCLEEAGGPDTLYVSPDDPQAMAAAIAQVLKGAPGRDQRILRSREYIRRFQGNDVAGQVYRLYLRLLNKE